jgi:hypothetical protein
MHLNDGVLPLPRVIYDGGVMEKFRILQQEVKSASERYDRIARLFQEIVTDPSSLPPHPDGIVHIRRLTRECREAGDELMKALQREVEFVTRRPVPTKRKK